MALFFVTCARNIESLLREELIALGCLSVKETIAGNYFEGEIEQAYRVCLWSRLANHVLLQLSQFEAHNADELYRHVQRIEWSSHLDVEGTLSIEVTGSHPAFNNPLFAAQKIKDAIVDQFRETHGGKRPSVENFRPDILLNLHMDKGICSLSLNLSGESLHRRGYRLEGGKAPLKENLAAAILIRAGWPKYLAEKREHYFFVDPMCGSGTLLVEAALMAFDIAPGLQRGYFGFLGWQQHQPSMWNALKEEAQDRRTLGLARNIIFSGSDIHPHAISKSLENIDNAGLSGRIGVHMGDCTQLRLNRLFPSQVEITPGEKGFIICNPPYGERMNNTGLNQEVSNRDLDGLYELFTRFGAALKKDFLGWQLGIFSGAPKACVQGIKMRAQRNYSLFNGALPCTLYLYEVSV
jgi:23S rRNA (guanine2445-N2)-methyltransferase / 23S rRNA (guanine2069-N7)-methyltransferase